MTDFESISVIILTISMFFAGFQLYRMNQENRKTHDWNRRLASHELMKSLSEGSFPDLVDKVRGYSNLEMPSNSSYSEVIKKVKKEDKDEFERDIRKLLNYLESFAVSVKNNIVDNEIMYDYASIIVTEWCKWAKDYFEKERNYPKPPEPSIYIDLENLAKGWIKKLNEEKEKSKQQILSSGKRKL